MCESNVGVEEHFLFANLLFLCVYSFIFYFLKYHGWAAARLAQR